MPMSSSVLTARRRRHAILFVSSVSRESLLRFVPFSKPVPDRRVVLVYRKSFPRPAAIEALRQAILDCPLQGVRKLDLPAV